MDNQDEYSKHGSELSKLGATRGGHARAAKLTPEARTAIAKKAAETRWGKKEESNLKEVEILGPLPVAKYRGLLPIMNLEVPCYVLDDGRRVISRTSATEMLTGIKGGGDLEKYIGVRALESFINRAKVLEGMVSFIIPEVEGLGRDVKGVPSDLWIEVCQGYVRGLEETARPDSPYRHFTLRQRQIAIRAGMFLSACAKVGLDSLIDEVTGYQYERAQDALEIKLRAYLTEEMRKWEKTFPDELWHEFGRLTAWKGGVLQRPKYWGKLVMELVYEYLDPDVAEWLKENAPKPRHGQNYHQWLSGQYGLKKLIEHIWMLIGMARACENMMELKERMAQQFGRVPIQLRLYLPAPKDKNSDHGN